MISRMRTCLAVLLLAACSSAPKSSAPTTPVMPTGATCDQVGAHMIQLLPANNDEGNAELVKALSGVLQDRCAKDGWSPQARQCIVDAKQLRDADGCKQYLTAAQVEATNKAMDERFPKPPAGQPSVNAGAPPPPPAETSAPPPPPPTKTRAPAKKKAPPKAGKAGDPCEGGE